MTKLVDKYFFELAYRRCMDEAGDSYDEWDINAAYSDYLEDPKRYEWLGLYL